MPKKKTRQVGFADDQAVIVTGKNKKNLEERTRSALTKIKEKLNKLDLEINEGTIEAVLLRQKRSTRNKFGCHTQL